MFRSLLPTPVPFVFVVLLILNPLATAWGNPVQTTTSDPLLPLEEAFPTISVPPQKIEVPVLLPEEMGRIKKKYDHLVTQISRKGHMEKDLMLSFIRFESNGNPNAENDGAKGLMQIKDGAKTDAKCKSIKAKEENLRCADRYWGYLIRGGCSNERECILAYNRGLKGMRKAMASDPWVLYTDPYVVKITAGAESFRGK